MSGVQGLGGGANGQGEEDLHCHRVVPRSRGEVVLLKHLSVKLRLFEVFVRAVSTVSAELC